MISPYSPTIIKFNPQSPASLHTQRQQLNTSPGKSMIKTGEMLGATFVTATVVGVGLGLIKKVTTPIILLASGIAAVPIGFTVKEFLSIFYKNNGTTNTQNYR